LSDKTEQLLVRAKLHSFVEGERNLRAEADARFDPDGEEPPALHKRVTVETVNDDDDKDEDVIPNPKKFVRSVVGDASLRIRHLSSHPSSFLDELFCCKKKTSASCDMKR
jgi:hypothetical protein